MWLYAYVTIWVSSKTTKPTVRSIESLFSKSTLNCFVPLSKFIFFFQLCTRLHNISSVRSDLLCLQWLYMPLGLQIILLTASVKCVSSYYLTNVICNICGKPHMQVSLWKDLWTQYNLYCLWPLLCTQKGVNFHLLKCNVIIIYPLKINNNNNKQTEKNFFHSIIYWQSALGIEWYKLKKATSLMFVRLWLLVYVFNNKHKVWQTFTATAFIQHVSSVKTTLSEKILICRR